VKFAVSQNSNFFFFQMMKTRRCIYGKLEFRSYRVSSYLFYKRKSLAQLRHVASFVVICTFQPGVSSCCFIITTVCTRSTPCSLFSLFIYVYLHNVTLPSTFYHCISVSLSTFIFQLQLLVNFLLDKRYNKMGDRSPEQSKLNALQYDVSL
jgi:hypothetical protein